jgi:hypothetical protein
VTRIIPSQSPAIEFPGAVCAVAIIGVIANAAIKAKVVFKPNARHVVFIEDFLRVFNVFVYSEAQRRKDTASGERDGSPSPRLSLESNFCRPSQ